MKKKITFCAFPQGCTVTICHIDTKDCAGHASRADILIVGVGVVCSPRIIPPFFWGPFGQDGSAMLFSRKHLSIRAIDVHTAFPVCSFICSLYPPPALSMRMHMFSGPTACVSSKNVFVLCVCFGGAPCFSAPLARWGWCARSG